MGKGALRPLDRDLSVDDSHVNGSRQDDRLACLPWTWSASYYQT